MGDLAYNGDYLAEARSRLPEQFKGLPRIDALLQAYMGEVQALENAMYTVFVARLLQNHQARGDLLDKLGGLVGQPRNGSSDAEYAVFISARIRANRSGGKAADPLALTTLLFPDSYPVVVRYYVKALEYEVYAVSVNPYIAWRDFLNGAVVAGDSVRLIASPVPRGATLTFDSVYGPAVTTTAQRRGSTHGGGGTGVYAAIYGQG